MYTCMYVQYHTELDLSDLLAFFSRFGQLGVGHEKGMCVSRIPYTHVRYM